MSTPRISVTITSLGTGVFIDRYPDTCPICSFGVQPRVVAAELTGSTVDRSSPVELQPKARVVVQCPRRSCSEVFVARYVPTYAPTGDLMFTFSTSVPTTPRKPSVSEEVAFISPSFVEIFTQAHEAEDRDLAQIAGMGYRKSLEFLIKDFVIHRSPDKADSIKGEWLGNVIKNYIDDSRILSTATRATWLGNDESHYIRKWETKDITDLKRLIHLCSNWIENVIVTEKYEDEMKAP